MELFGTNLLVGFLIVSYLSSDVVNGKTVDTHIVTAIEKRTGYFWCMGGVVSKNGVITSCKCVGSFAPPDFDNFDEINPKNYKVKTSMGVEYPIVKVIKHSSCAISYLNYTVNDLGGWKIRGSFEDTVNSLMPFFNRGITFEEAEVRINKCFILSYTKLVTGVFEVNATGMNYECFYFYCETRLAKKGQECDSFKASLFGAELQCGFIHKKAGTVRGSPILCNVKDEESSVYYTPGLVGWSDEMFVFWTRFDLTANRYFYSALVGARADRFSSFNAALIFLLVKYVIPLFQ